MKNQEIIWKDGVDIDYENGRDGVLVIENTTRARVIVDNVASPIEAVRQLFNNKKVAKSTLPDVQAKKVFVWNDGCVSNFWKAKFQKYSLT
jgi:hypothetical protein